MVTGRAGAAGDHAPRHAVAVQKADQGRVQTPLLYMVVTNVPEVDSEVPAVTLTTVQVSTNRNSNSLRL